jgi:glycine betaine/proline transport system substrate-binding protein
MFSKRTTILLSAVLALGLLLSACTPANGADPNGQPAKERVRISDTAFQTLWINNEIAKFAIETGYEYPVEIMDMSSAVMWQSMMNGQIDLHTELWRMNTLDLYNQAIDEGSMLDLGEIYDRSTQGFYVPRYVIEGDPERGIEPMAPDLRSVFDLPQYKGLFADPADPNKGRIINCITTWQCATVNRAKLYAYGLMKDYNIMEPGAAAALDAAIAGAYEQGEPFVSYYWEPTWLAGMYDLVQLEEPEYTEECWVHVDRVLDGEMDAADTPPEGGCAYQTVGIHKGVHSSLEERAPELVSMLEKMFLGTDVMNELAAYMESEEATAEETALHFYRNYDLWRDWVTEDAAARMDAGLAEGA